MIYIILNIVCVLFLIFFTHLMDTKQKSNSAGSSSLSIAMLITAIESILFVLVLIMQKTGFIALIVPIIRIAFAIDGIAFMSVAFSILDMANLKRHPAVTILKIVLVAFALYIAFFKFKTIDISFENGIVIDSDYLINGPAREFFPITWVTLFAALYRYIIPLAGLLFLYLLQEDKNATQLEKYQTVVMGEGVLMMWLINLAIRFISTAAPAFTLLYLFSYLFMYVVFYIAISKITVPSGKAMFVTMFKSVVSYIIPAALVGVLSMLLQPEGNNFTTGFIASFIGYSIAAGIQPIMKLLLKRILLM